jgi:hypothetical protein
MAVPNIVIPTEANGGVELRVAIVWNGRLGVS